MSIDQSQQGYTVKPVTTRLRRFLSAPLWYVRLRLQWTLSAIDRIERQLGDEFALSEQSPLHDELSQLIAQRDQLLKRFDD